MFLSGVEPLAFRLGVRVTLVPTCYLMSTKVSIYQESRHLIENPCQYKLTGIIPFLIFTVSSLLEMLTRGINHCVHQNP